MHVSRALGGVTILEKGAQDVICTNTEATSAADARASKVDASESTEEQVVVDVLGGLKRCGGQGDILSGTVGTALAWGKCFEDGAYGSVSRSSYRDVSLTAEAQRPLYPVFPSSAACGGRGLDGDTDSVTTCIFQAGKR